MLSVLEVLGNQISDGPVIDIEEKETIFNIDGDGYN